MGDDPRGMGRQVDAVGWTAGSDEVRALQPLPPPACLSAPPRDLFRLIPAGVSRPAAGSGSPVALPSGPRRESVCRRSNQSPCPAFRLPHLDVPVHRPRRRSSVRWASCCGRGRSMSTSPMHPTARGCWGGTWRRRGSCCAPTSTESLRPRFSRMRLAASDRRNLGSHRAQTPLLGCRDLRFRCRSENSNHTRASGFLRTLGRYPASVLGACTPCGGRRLLFIYSYLFVFIRI